MSNALASKAIPIFTFAITTSMALGQLLFSLFSHSFILLALPLTITVTVLLVWRVKVLGKTKARIEICGNDISSFDDLGNPSAIGNMREIAAVFRSHWANTDKFEIGKSAPIVDFFHVLFLNGTVITFHEHYDNYANLLKSLHARTGVDPIRLSWSDFQMLELELPEHRALKAAELKFLA